jgi:FkbM family methyltransferase
VGAWLPARVRRALRTSYNAALARTAGDFVCTLPAGERVRVLPEHRQITWNPEEYVAFRAAVRPGDVVMDIGANLGAYTLLFGLWTGPRGRVFAFEPAPIPYAGLTAHVTLNGLSERISVLPQAVSSREGPTDFIADGIDGANRIASSTHRGDHPTIVQVTATTVDAFCRQRRLMPNMIKVDAEGAELDVLRGARETIRAAGPSLTLFVEMHPHLWPGFGTSREEIEAELTRQHLTAERLDGAPDIWAMEGVCLRIRPCAS